MEIRVGQDVKPEVGGRLPAHKVSEENTRTRGLKPGEDSVSPGRLSGVNNLEGLKKMVSHIKNITNGKPVAYETVRI